MESLPKVFCEAAWPTKAAVRATAAAVKRPGMVTRLEKEGTKEARTLPGGKGKKGDAD